MVLTLEQTKTLLGSHKRFIKYFNMGMTMAHIKMQELRAVSRSCSSSALSGHGRRLGSSWDEALHIWTQHGCPELSRSLTPHCHHRAQLSNLEPAQIHLRNKEIGSVKSWGVWKLCGWCFASLSVQVNNNKEFDGRAQRFLNVQQYTAKLTQSLAVKQQISQSHQIY